MWLIYLNWSVTEQKKSTAAAKGQCAGEEVCPLSRVPVGSTVCIKALVASPEVLKHLMALGISEEQELKLLSRASSKSNFVCKVCDATLDLNAELAEAILVEELPILPLYHWASPSLAHPRLKAIPTTPSGGVLFEQFQFNEP